MEEIVELRTENSKTFKKDDGTFHTEGKSVPLHYNEGGEWKEINTEPSVDNENKRVEFNGLLDSVSVDTDTFCGTLSISGNTYNITVDISPFAKDIPYSNEDIFVDSDNSEKCVLSQELTKSSNFRYTVSNTQIKPESVITDLDHVPEGYAFKIKFDGLNAEYSNNEHKIREVEKINDGEETETSVNYSPVRIDFKDDGDTMYSFTEPVFIDGNGEKRVLPLKIESKSSTSITGYYDTPTNEWCKNAIEETGSLVMDPAVDSNLNFVTNGDTQNHTTTENIDIYNEQVRWRGDDRTETDTDNYTYLNTGQPDNGNTFDGYYVTGNHSSTLDVPSSYDGSIDSVSIRTQPRAEAGASQSPDSIDPIIQSVEHEHTGLSGYSEEVIGTTFSESPDDIYVSTESVDSSVAGTTVDFVFDITQDPDYDTYDNPYVEDCRRYVRLYTTETTSTTYSTENPSVSINGTSYSPSTNTLDDGEYSSFISTNAIVSGDNTFSHSISSSGQAYFEYQYDYEYLPPEAPGNLTVTGPEF